MHNDFSKTIKVLILVNFILVFVFIYLLKGYQKDFYLEVEVENKQDIKLNDYVIENKELEDQVEFKEGKNLDTGIDIELEGTCGLDGSSDQYDIFEKNPCKILNSQTGEIYGVAEEIYPCEKTENQKFCVGVYESFFLGKKEGNKRYIYTSGGEGGSVWTKVYQFDLDIKKLSLIENISIGTIEVLEEDQQRFNSVLENYGIEYYENLYFYIDTPECQFPNEYNEECRFQIQQKQSEDCIDLQNAKAYTAECFENYSLLTSQQQEKFIINLNNLSK